MAGQYAVEWRAFPGAEISSCKHSKAWLAGRRELPAVVTRLAVSRQTAPSRSSEPCWSS